MRIIGRDRDTLELNRRVKKKPRFVTETEFKKLLPKIRCADHEMIQLICRVAFATGLRKGEIFGIEPHHVREQGTKVFVEQQMEENGQMHHETKSRMTRTAIVVPGYEADVIMWSKIKLKDRMQYRNKKTTEYLTAAHGQLLKFHDLRHSYAILMLKEFALDYVAKSLGNSKIICETFYVGFDLNKEDEDYVVKRWREKRKQSEAHK